MKTIFLFYTLVLLICATEINAQAATESGQNNETELSLITDTPEEGFQVAVQLARKAAETFQRAVCG